MKHVDRKILFIKLFILVILFLIPFSISDYSDSIVPEKITSDLAFYEINTCKISLNEFLLHNLNVIYQDHYKIRFNNYSSISCFGQITGIDQIGYNFYISIGTNTIINIFLQSFIWILIISMLPVDKNITRTKISDILLLGLVSLIFCLLIYSEKRYYNNYIFFELDLQQQKSYIFLFIYIFTISYVTKTIIENRADDFVNYLPFLYIFIGVISGLNFYFLFIFFSFFGIKNLLINKKLRNKFYIINLLIFFWSYQAVGLNFYLKPDKIRGLSHADYNFLSVLVWSYLIIFVLIGTYYFLIEKLKKIDTQILRDNFILSSALLLFFGYLGSSMPFINFVNYYFFGQTKYGTDNSNLFSVNFWGESEAWRGFFPSAETIGEFYALTILLIFLFTKRHNLFSFFGVAISLVGLYAANNKAALVALLFCLFLKINSNKNLNLYIKLLFFSIPFFMLIYFIRIENLTFSFDFLTNKMIDMGVSYSSLGETSSSLLYLLDNLKTNFVLQGLFSIFSATAFLINRSELWGLFFARFNPTFETFLFGTGPFVLSNHYGDINISSIRISTGTDLGFLLPHSSLLLLLVFFGLIGLIITLTFMIYAIIKSKKINYNFYIINIFILLNLIKSDSLLYFPSIVLYSIFFLTSLKGSKIN